MDTLNYEVLAKSGYNGYILRSFEANFGIPHLAQQRTALFGYNFD